MSLKPNRQSLAPRLIPLSEDLTRETCLIHKTEPAATKIRRVNSRNLLGDQTCLHIEHEGLSYVLRATRLGKLILTK